MWRVSENKHPTEIGVRLTLNVNVCTDAQSTGGG